MKWLLTLDWHVRNRRIYTFEVENVAAGTAYTVIYFTVIEQTELTHVYFHIRGR